MLLHCVQDLEFLDTKLFLLVVRLLGLLVYDLQGASELSILEVFPLVHISKQGLIVSEEVLNTVWQILADGQSLDTRRPARDTLGLRGGLDTVTAKDAAAAGDHHPVELPAPILLHQGQGTLVTIDPVEV